MLVYSLSYLSRINQASDLSSTGPQGSSFIPMEEVFTLVIILLYLFIQVITMLLFGPLTVNPKTSLVLEGNFSTLMEVRSLQVIILGSFSTVEPIQQLSLYQWIDMVIS